MRLASAFALIVFVVQLPANANPAPADTTEPTRYLALQVGNLWEYETWADQCDPEPPFCNSQHTGYLRRLVERDTTIDSTHFWVIGATRFNTLGNVTGSEMHLVRYDSTEARAYAHDMNGELLDYWPDFMPCALDHAPTREGECEASIYETSVLDTDVVIKTITSWKGWWGGWTFAVDIGLVTMVAGHWAYHGYELVYALVDGVEYGTQAPVSAEEAPDRPDALAMEVYPNPAAGRTAISVRLEVAERLRLEVFDLLGRHVVLLHDGDLPPGTHTFAFEASGLRSGTYFVRASTGAHAVTTTASVTR